MMAFQSTLPAGEATCRHIVHTFLLLISIHASRRGSDKRASWWRDRHPQFQSTLPAGEATSLAEAAAHSTVHFNPRFPRGKRPLLMETGRTQRAFQSTLPAREATRPALETDPDRLFQSTLPAREATNGGDLKYLPRFISIHASRGGSDVPEIHLIVLSSFISIHASRGGSDS